MQRQGLVIRKKSAALLQIVNIYSPKNTHDALYLNNYATINVVDDLARIRGVGQATLFGALDYSLRLWIDPDRLTALKLTPSDVVAAVQGQNVQAALGRIGSAPVPAAQQLQLTIKTLGRLTTVEQFGNIIVRANPDGSVVRVKDVARPDIGAKSQERYSRYNTAPAGAIGIYQSPGANAVEVARQVRETMQRLKQRFPDDVAYDTFYDATVFVTSTIDEVVRTLVIAFVLVGIVVFLFLGKLRTTIIPLVAVPVSIVGTFAVLLASGYSANTVSLLALVLAIGIVVDDAIVVIENVERVIEEEPDLSIPDATKKAMREITGPIIAITLVLLSVFVPVAFIPGISGQLFRQFAVAVSASMIISAINALTLSPALCSVLLKRGDGARRGPMRYVLDGIDRVRDGYGSIVARLVRVAVIGVVVVAGVGSSHARHVQDNAAGLPAGRRPGRVLRRHAPARRRLAQPHGEPGRRGREHRAADPRRAGHAVGRRTELHRLRRLVQPGVLRHPAEAVRAAHAAGGDGRRDHRPAAPAAGRDRGRGGVPLQPAARARSRQYRRLPVCARGAAGPDAVRSRRHDARPPRHRQPAARAGGRVQHLRLGHAADLSRDRPRQGPGAGRQDQPTSSTPCSRPSAGST